jgi:hypothetical protein
MKRTFAIIQPEKQEMTEFKHINEAQRNFREIDVRKNYVFFLFGEIEMMLQGKNLAEENAIKVELFTLAL